MPLPTGLVGIAVTEVLAVREGFVSIREDLHKSIDFGTERGID